MLNVEISREEKRGCGYRKPAKDGVGIYLMSGQTSEPCERLPFPLDVCPCCGAGIKFSRAFTWVNAPALFDPEIIPICYCFNADRKAYNDLSGGHHHASCPLCNPSIHPEGKAGLLWVGEKFYSPRSFMQEVAKMGISKKIPAIPHGFEIGKHWIFLAHIKAIAPPMPLFDEKTKPSAGIITAFLPDHIDLVINNANDIPEKASKLKEKLGDAARLVVVEQIPEDEPIPQEAQAAEEIRTGPGSLPDRNP